MEFLSRVVNFLSSEPAVLAFWLPLAVGLIIFILDRMFSRRGGRKTIKIKLTLKIVKEEYKKHVIEIHHRTPTAQPAPTLAATRSSNDGAPAAIGIGVLLLSFFYARFQTEIILAILGFSVFLLTYLILTAAFLNKNNVAYGRDWKLFFAITFGLIVYAFPLMYIALHPLYSPPQIDSMSMLFNSGGAAALYKQYGFAGIGFLVFQTLGFLLLVFAQFLQFLSLTFYMSITQVVLSEKKRPLHELVIQATKRFSRPYKVIGMSIALYVVSTILISGLAYDWWYRNANQAGVGF